MPSGPHHDSTPHPHGPRSWVSALAVGTFCPQVFAWLTAAQHAGFCGERPSQTPCKAAPATPTQPGPFAPVALLLVSSHVCRGAGAAPPDPRLSPSRHQAQHQTDEQESGVDSLPKLNLGGVRRVPQSSGFSSLCSQTPGREQEN